MTGKRKIVLATILAFSGSLAAHAADQTILGNQLQVKNPSTADKRKVVVKAKEKLSPNTIVGNPTVSGASLSVAAGGGTPSAQVFPLNSIGSLPGCLQRNAANDIRVPGNLRST